MRLMARTEQGSARSTQASQHCDHRSAHGMLLIIVEVACDARPDGFKPGLSIMSSRAPLDTYLNAKRVQTNCGMIMIGWTAQHCIVVATVASWDANGKPSIWSVFTPAWTNDQPSSGNWNSSQFGWGICKDKPSEDFDICIYRLALICSVFLLSLSCVWFLHTPSTISPSFTMTMYSVLLLSLLGLSSVQATSIPACAVSVSRWDSSNAAKR